MTTDSTTLIDAMRSDLARLQQRIDNRQAKGVTEDDPVIARAIGRKVELERAFAVMDQLQARVAAFKAFTDAMLDISWKGGDADGAHIQELALKFGLLQEVVETERCSDERCICAEVTDFPTTCNRKTYLGKEAE